MLTAEYWPNATLTTNCATELAPYVSYAYPSGSAQAAALKACGLKTVLYITPSMPQKGEAYYAAMASTYPAAQAKDCSGKVITTYGGSGYLLDPHGAQAQSFYQYTIDSQIGRGPAPYAIFTDNSDSIYQASAQPCDWKGYDDWTVATTSVLAKLNTHGAQLILNDLSLPESYMVQPVGDTVENVLKSMTPATVAGGEQEGFIYQLGTAGYAPTRWQWEIDTEIGAVNAHKIYWAYANQNLSSLAPASSAGIAARMYLYASWLLGYDDADRCSGPSGAQSCTIYQTWFNTASGLRVMPETGIVATQPLRTAKTAVTDLEIGTSGAFGRAFAACFYRDVAIGPCEPVVNPSTSTVALSLPQFAHSVVLFGSDPLDHGSVSWSGPTVTKLAPHTAAILTP